MRGPWQGALVVVGVAVCAVHLSVTDAQPKESSEPPLIQLAPVDTAQKKPAVLSKVRKLNKLARKALRSGQYQEAIAHSKAAAEMDPGSIAARYRLSNAYALGGMPEAGFAVLKQFQDAQESCNACVDRLARARLDHDWGAYHSDPRFIAVTETTVKMPTVEEAAASLLKGLKSGTIDPFASLVHPRKRLKLEALEWTAVHHDDFLEPVGHRMVRGKKGLEQGTSVFRRAKLRVDQPFECREIDGGVVRCYLEEQKEGVAVSTMDFSKGGGGVYFLTELGVGVGLDQPGVTGSFQ